MTTRRDFLSRTLGASSLLAVGGVVPEFLATTAHAADTIGRAVTPEAKPVETPAPADALAWARKLTEERTIADLQPGRWESAPTRISSFRRCRPATLS